MADPFLHVALGGATGATLRYAMGLGIGRAAGGATGFPLAILTANIVGLFLMGAFVVAAARHGLMHLSPRLATGPFTTFSPFSLEAVTLWERGAPAQAALYVGLSVGLSLLALLGGLSLAGAVL